MEEEKNPKPIYLVPDLLEEILLRLPSKSIFKFKIVAKQWRSILGSRRFAERRMGIQKKRKILAAVDHRTESRFEGDEEIEVVYKHYDDGTTRASLTCDGLICIPGSVSVKVFNPSTGESIRFPFWPDTVTNGYDDEIVNGGFSLCTFAACWMMGFGRDIVDGSYKVVRMFFDACEVLDVNIGEWRQTRNPPLYKVVETKSTSACVNGSIYWLDMYHTFSILALDLHTQEFRDISPPPSCSMLAQMVNLEDRLTIAESNTSSLEIWFLDAKEETWSMTYSISLMSIATVWFRPVAISKQGNLFFYDSRKMLFKYYPHRNFLCCLSQDMCVISPFVENLVSLPPSLPKTSGYRASDAPIHSSIFQQIKLVEVQIICLPPRF